MLQLKYLFTYLNELLQVDLFEDYGPNGLQVEGKKEVKVLVVAVSASLNVIKQAAALNADAILVHHGLFWSKDSYVIKGTKKEKIKVLLENDMSLLAYHLPLDAHKEFGNNWKAALDMGWSDLKPFRGIGVEGVVDNLPAQEFKRRLEEYYGHKAHAVLVDRNIKRAALISGGAHKELPKAAESGLDAYVTGSFDEPSYHQAHEEHINFYALGHAATETVGVRALGAHLEEKWGIQVHFVDENNPF